MVLTVAQELLDVRKLQVMVLGGQLRSENASLVGPQAEAMLDGLWFDQLFLGASAIGEDGAIYIVDAAEASLNARMLARVGRAFRARRRVEIRHHGHLQGRAARGAAHRRHRFRRCRRTGADGLANSASMRRSSEPGREAARPLSEP